MECHRYISEDLIIDILSRLPVKSILRFRSVCKGWKDIIINPNFITKHLHHESNNTKLLVFWKGYRKLAYTPYYFQYAESFAVFSKGKLGMLKTNNDMDNSYVVQSSVYHIFSDGFHYWKKHNKTTNTWAILAFDMHNEVFQELELPIFLKLRSNLEIDLWNGLLAILCTTYKHVEIWVLKENGCWTNSLVVEMSLLSYPLGFWEDNKILVREYNNEKRGSELVMFDIDADDYHKTRKLETEKIGAAYVTELLYPLQYKESLVSVKGEYGAQDFDTQSVECLRLFQK